MPFSGARIYKKEDFAKVLLLGKLDNVILHVGTNNLDLDKSAECIAGTIVKHELLLKNNVRDVIISKFITQKKLKVEGEEADSHNEE